ncbi:MAG: ATP synthase F1 subunit epsilon [Eubacteriales bacterium]
MAKEQEFEIKIITPDRVFYEDVATMVEFNTTEGEIGVFKNHIPMTVIVQPGILALTNEDSVKIAALHSGFAVILADKITIMAEIIEWPSEIDLDRATAARERAENRINMKENATDLLRAETALHRAMARIEVLK